MLESANYYGKVAVFILALKYLIVKSMKNI